MALARALLSLRAAWSPASGPAARSFSQAAAARGADAAPAAASAAAASAAAEPGEGAKAKLFEILKAASGPLTAAQVWEAAQQQGLRSKRFTKAMLGQLRAAGFVKTQPLGGTKKQKAFGYRLNLEAQKKRDARLQQKAEHGGGGGGGGSAAP